MFGELNNWLNTNDWLNSPEGKKTIVLLLCAWLAPLLYFSWAFVAWFLVRLFQVVIWLLVDLPLTIALKLWSLHPVANLLHVRRRRRSHNLSHRLDAEIDQVHVGPLPD